MEKLSDVLLCLLLSLALHSISHVAGPLSAAEGTLSSSTPQRIAPLCCRPPVPGPTGESGGEQNIRPPRPAARGVSVYGVYVRPPLTSLVSSADLMLAFEGFHCVSVILCVVGVGAAIACRQSKKRWRCFWRRSLC